METPILYYWAPCVTCAMTVDLAAERGIELDKRDIEQEQPYKELLALGGDENKIPYLYADGQLIQGVEDINAYLEKTQG